MTWWNVVFVAFLSSVTTMLTQWAIELYTWRKMAKKAFDTQIATYYYRPNGQRVFYGSEKQMENLKNTGVTPKDGDIWVGETRKFGE